MALTDKGHLYCSGYNGYGQCGSGNTSQQRSLVETGLMQTHLEP